jgi:hypothetical protein
VAAGPATLRAARAIGRSATMPTGPRGSRSLPGTYSDKRNFRADHSGRRPCVYRKLDSAIVVMKAAEDGRRLRMLIAPAKKRESVNLSAMPADGTRAAHSPEGEISAHPVSRADFSNTTGPYACEIEALLHARLGGSKAAMSGSGAKLTSPPMRRIRSPGCARAASGHAAAPLPKSVMNSRRLMGSPVRPRITP